MAVVGIAMMKDEEDVARHVVEHMADEGLDAIIIADNGSTDRTREELRKAVTSCPLWIRDDDEVGYYQSRKMTALARMAYEEFGAQWIVPFDADEIWYSRTDRIGHVLANLPNHIGVAQATLYNHFCTSLDEDSDNPFESLTWRQKEPGALPKVAFRWDPNAVIRQGNHSVEGVPGYSKTLLELRHFPYRSWGHFLRKAENGAAAYKATDLSADQGAHWRGYWEIRERHGEEALKEVFDTYFNFLSPIDEGMIKDPAPFKRWTIK